MGLSPSPSSTPGASQAPDKRFEQIGVLLIEDERVIREIIVRMLKSIGVKKIIEEATAEGGWQALVSGKDHPVNVVITDLTLPGASGTTFIKALRERTPPNAKPFPVIVLTGRNDLETYKTLQPYGVSSYLIKPVSADLLRSSIEKAVFSKPTEQSGKK